MSTKKLCYGNGWTRNEKSRKKLQDETDLSYFISIPSMWRLSIANRGIILQSSIKIDISQAEVEGQEQIKRSSVPKYSETEG